MSYQFLDAHSSVQTAASSVVSGANEPLVQISSFLSAVPTTPTGNQSVSGTVNIGGTPNVAITSIATAGGALPVTAPLSARIQGSADFRLLQGASVAAITAQGAGIRAYVDHVQIANYGPSSVLVTIADNTTSILGYTIAPAGGGSNYNCMYRPEANSPITASINGTASVLVSMQGFTGA